MKKAVFLFLSGLYFQASAYDPWLKKMQVCHGTLGVQAPQVSPLGVGPNDPASEKKFREHFGQNASAFTGRHEGKEVLWLNLSGQIYFAKIGSAQSAGPKEVYVDIPGKPNLHIELKHLKIGGLSIMFTEQEIKSKGSEKKGEIKAQPYRNSLPDGLKKQMVKNVTSVLDEIIDKNKPGSVDEESQKFERELKRISQMMKPKCVTSNVGGNSKKTSCEKSEFDKKFNGSLSSLQDPKKLRDLSESIGKLESCKDSLRGLRGKDIIELKRRISSAMVYLQRKVSSPVPGGPADEKTTP